MPTELQNEVISFSDREKITFKRVSTVNLNQLAMLLDAAAQCGNRQCNSCKELFNSEESCPLWLNKENSLEALKAIEKYLDDKYDKEEEIRGETLVKILTGEIK